MNYFLWTSCNYQGETMATLKLTYFLSLLWITCLCQDSLGQTTTALTTITTTSTTTALATIPTTTTLEPTPIVCPLGCSCNRRKDDSDASGIKVICCQENDEAFTFPPVTVDGRGFPVDTVRLNLSNCGLTVIPSGAFSGLPSLTRLDLSQNSINSIYPGAFNGLTNLLKLNLTYNDLTTVNTTIFQGLLSVVTISLSENPLRTLPESVFDGLPELKRVDFQSDVLYCDCKLGWMVGWLRATHVRTQTSCAIPLPLQGMRIRKLKEKDLHCNWPIQLDLFQLKPSTSQIVFQGDQLPFECHASVIDSSMQLLWIRNGQLIAQNNTFGFVVSSTISSDGRVMTTELTISSLEMSHTGIWKCVVLSPHGNATKSVNIVVISDQTKYCPPLTSTTNKGIFFWPKTVSDVTIDLPCEHGAAHGFPTEPKVAPIATHFCNVNGHWVDLDVSQCQYESEVTRILEKFAKTDIGNLSSVIDGAGKLVSYIQDAKVLTDKMDIVYIADILETVSHTAATDDKIGETVIQIVSILLKVDPELLKEAQREASACTKIVRVVESLPQLLLSDQKKACSIHADNIVLHAYQVQLDSYMGLTCFSRSLPMTVPHEPLAQRDRSFMCGYYSNYTMTTEAAEKLPWEAFIHVPRSVLTSAKCPGQACPPDHDYQLSFILYRNANLFPIFDGRRAEVQEQSRYVVGTNVISTNVVGMQVSNLSEPIEVSLVTNLAGEKKPVYWDAIAFDGLGAWSTRGCWMMKETEKVATFQCNHMTQYALLQMVPGTSGMQIMYFVMMMLTLHPAMYAGSSVLCIACFLIVITYAFSPRELKMSGKAKHAIANMALSILLLCLTFTFGIRLTFVVLPCQMVGIALHYFSICTLFWILINTYNLFRKFTKHERPPLDPMELDGPPPVKPMLRFYLIGWGIAIIICGITSAVNLTFYAAGKPYCFLSFDPSVGAFYVPVCIIVTLCIIFFLRSCCFLRSISNLPNPDEPETEEINDLEITNQEIESLPIDNQSQVSAMSSNADMEYRPVSQLRALAAVLVLYMVTWVTAAFAIGRPFAEYIPYYDLIFPYAYAFFSGVLGIFLLSFYVVGRGDARGAWRKMCCCCCFVKKRPVYMMNANNTSRTTPTMNHLNGGLRNGHLGLSHSSINSDFTSKSSNTNRSNALKYNNGPKKQSNLNLVQTHTPSITDPSVIGSINTDTVPNFYNPRQNGVAKKYWQKRQAKQAKVSLLNAEKNYEGGSCSDTRSHRSHDRNRLGSHNGNSSDNNTQLSHHELPCVTAQHQNNLYSAKPLNIDPLTLDNFTQSNDFCSPYLLPTHTPLLPMMPLDRSQISPGGGHISPVPSGVGSDHRSCGGRGMPSGTTNSIGHVESQVDEPCTFGVRPNMSSFGPGYYNHYSLPRSKNEMPGQQSGLSGPRNLLGMQYTPIESMQRNGSVPRLRENESESISDSKGGEQRPRPHLNTDIQNLEMYKPPEPPVIEGPTKLAYNPLEESLIHDENHPASTHSTGSRKKRKNESFMDQLEQRIPHSKSPGLTRSNPSSRDGTLKGSYERVICGEESQLPNEIKEMESDKCSDGSENSRVHSQISEDPTSKTSSSCSSQNKKVWEDEFKDRPSKPCYAYINHSYRDKVMNKLISDSGGEGGGGGGLNWFPRSVSAYEQVANDITSLGEDSSSSSSDDSTEDIWVPQRKKKRKFKKETSV